MRLYKRSKPLYAIAAIKLLKLVSATELPGSSTCRYLPSDPLWPSMESWAELNATVSGRLIASVPLATVCHGSEYSATACESLQESWIYAAPHIKDPSSIYSPYWLNNSCSPFTYINSTCSLGNLVAYTINVSSATDVVAGLKFARKNNVRLVVKNTGHDFLGRSTGKGALGLWIHHLKNISFVEYDSVEYQGAAVRIEAGVQGSELNSVAAAHGVRTVTGWCPSVGIAGGYTSGGGHGPLASSYGLAADNTLAFEVVTVDGEFLIASQSNHSDLYWALSGGGAGTYAVILAQTSKTYPDGYVGGLSLTFTHDNSADFWYRIFQFWQSYLLRLDELAGFSSGTTITNTSFSIGFITWPGHTGEEVLEAITPFLQHLDSENIHYNITTTTEPNYSAHFFRHSPPDYPDFGVVGERLIPREAVRQNGSALIRVMRKISASGPFTLIMGQMNVSHAVIRSEANGNAVLPAWRDALYALSATASWDPASSITELDQLQHAMNDIVIAPLRDLTAESGSYSNEGTFNLPTWKEDYFGRNYDKLFALKMRYDPSHVLYGATTVGSDYWEIDEDGRLCKV